MKIFDLKNITIEGRSVFQIANMERGFIDALYFADTGEIGQPDQDAELAPETRALITAECLNFYIRQHAPLQCLIDDCERLSGVIDLTDFFYQVGMDLYYTSVGHGTGFWDREELYKEWTSRFTGHCEDRNLEIYQGDNKLIYFI